MWTTGPNLLTQPHWQHFADANEQYHNAVTVADTASMHLLQQPCSLQLFMWTALLCEYEWYWRCLLLCFQSDLVDQNLLNFLPLGEHSEVYKALSTHKLEGETLTPDYLKSKNPSQTCCFNTFIISSWPNSSSSLSLSLLLSHFFEHRSQDKSSLVLFSCFCYVLIASLQQRTS